MIGKTLAKKLRSNSGASLSIALLLFLVCAVLGSIILKSGTAASGRVADMAKADARYYSVTSAADYLADAITTAHIAATPTSAAKDDRRTVVITREATTTSTDTSSYNGETWSNPSKTAENTTYSWPVIKDNSATDSDNAETILTRAVQDIFFGGSIGATKACWEKDQPSIKDADGKAGTKSYDFDLKFTRGGNADKDLTVHVDETIRQNGDIELMVSNINEEDPKKVYKVQMVFVLTSKTTSKSTTKTASNPEGSAEEGTLVLHETTTTTESKTTTCFWTLSEIRKVN